MSEIEEIPSRRGGAASAAATTKYSATVSSSSQKPAPVLTAFNRQELTEILKIYGRNVAEGEWRDYAIDHLRDKAVFSIFRRTAEMPLFRIEKVPKLARKQGAYSVIAPGGMILKRGQDLTNVLKVFDRRKHLKLVGI